MSYEYVGREEWDIKNQFDFMKEFIETLSDYSLVVLEISKKYSVTTSQAESYLSRFAQTLVANFLSGIKDEFIVDLISTFIGDLEKHQVTWNIKLFIDGLWLDEDYEINDAIKIRPFKSSDLEVEKPFDIFSFRAFNDIHSTSSAVLELIYRAYDQKEIHDNITILLNYLRLFRLGSIISVRQEKKPKSILRGESISTPNVRLGDVYKYFLSKEDVPNLSELIKRIDTFSPKKIFVAPSEEATPISISIQRFNDALFRNESIESQITSAITCFEALYLKAEERTELAHRLSQRASIILGFLDLPPIEVYNVLSKAYEIRSIYIHGSQTGPEERRNIADHARKVMDYSRLSLLVFIQMMPVMDKDNLISKIDNSLLDEKARIKLKELIHKNCIIYK